MRAGLRRCLAAAGLGAMLLAACGGSSGGRKPVSASHLPLAPGARIIQRVRQCDRGDDAFCQLELVLVDRGLRSSGDLISAERRALLKAAWTAVPGNTGAEQGANSPGNRLFVTYATALNDLTGIDEVWLKRPLVLALTLAREVLAREPAISIMLQRGPA